MTNPDFMPALQPADAQTAATGPGMTPVAAPAPAPHEPTFAGKTRAEVAAFRQQYGEHRVKTVRAGELEAILRAPTRLEFERFVQTSGKAERRPELAMTAIRTLVLDCTLAPSRDELSAALDYTPGIAPALMAPIQTMAGMDIEVEEVTF